VPRLRMSGTIHLLTLHAFMAWTRTTLLFYLYLFKSISAVISINISETVNIQYKGIMQNTVCDKENSAQKIDMQYW
jgi:hypothetical protein